MDSATVVRRKYSPRYLVEIVVEITHDLGDVDCLVVERLVYEDELVMNIRSNELFKKHMRDEPYKKFYLRKYRLTRINK